MITATQELIDQVLQKPSLWLFLDYDGTLSDFAATPGTIDPHPQIIQLINRFALQKGLQLAIVSGRRLQDIQSLIPVKGIYVAGTYGVEIIAPGGNLIQRTRYHNIRPFLEIIKPKWLEIIGDKTGFYVEDKGWAVALHAKLGGEEDAKIVLSSAREVVEKTLPEEQFRILSGHRFLEAAPLLAHKGKTVSYLLDHNPMASAQILYIGDDDKDEEAFEIIDERGGIAIKVITETTSSQPTRAHYMLDTPFSVHNWLEELAERREAMAGSAREPE